MNDAAGACLICPQQRGHLVGARRRDAKPQAAHLQAALPRAAQLQRLGKDQHFSTQQAAMPSDRPPGACAQKHYPTLPYPCAQSKQTVGW